MSAVAGNGWAGCVEAIESAYEFMLAYAAQGASGDGAGAAGSEIRSCLERADRAMGELPARLDEAIQARKPAAPEAYRTFAAVVERDAGHAQAAFRLVLAQPAIGSQAIDNLNALIHLRALLTDLFLMDEILRPQGQAEQG